MPSHQGSSHSPWLSAGSHIAPPPSTAAPGAQMSDRKAFHEAKQSKLDAFLAGSLSDKTKGKGRAVDVAAGPSRTKKAKVSEPLPSKQSIGSSKGVRSSTAGPSTTKPEAPRPVKTHRLSAPLPSRRTPFPSLTSRPTRSYDTRIKEEPQSLLLEEVPAKRRRAEIETVPVKQEEEVALVGPGPSTTLTRAHSNRSPSVLTTEISHLRRETPSSPTDDSDGVPSRRPNANDLSASLAPYLPDSFPSPERLPSHLLDLLMPIGRPFHGPTGRERYLKRPRMTWEKDEAWETRQRELKEWQQEKDRKAGKFVPPDRTTSRGFVQVQEEEEIGKDRDQAESDLFAPSPPKSRFPKVVPPPRVSAPPLGPRSVPTTVDSSQKKDVPHPEPPPESFAISATCYLTPAVIKRRAEATERARVLAQDAASQRSNRLDLLGSQKSVPRRLTDEEETSIILHLSNEASPSPELRPSTLPRSLTETPESPAHRVLDERVPSSQTEDSPLRPRKGLLVLSGKILAFASQESDRNDSPTRSVTQSPSVDGASTPKRVVNPPVGSSSRLLPFSAVVTPSRLHDDCVPTSEVSERVSNLLVKESVVADSRGNDEASPSPTPVKSKVMMTASTAAKGKGKAKGRISWPVWNGGIFDPTQLEEEEHDAHPASQPIPTTNILDSSKPLVQDSLLQHGFARSLTRSAHRSAGQEGRVVPLDEQITDEEDETTPPPQESLVPSSQSLAPLHWVKKVGPVPDPLPRAVLARPARRPPPASKRTQTPLPPVVIPDSQPSPNELEDADITLVNPPPPPCVERASSPSTSEDEVDADATLHAPGPLSPLPGSQDVIPDSQHASSSQDEVHPPPDRPAARLALGGQSSEGASGEFSFGWARSSSSDFDVFSVI